MQSLRAPALALTGLVAFLLLWEAIPFFGIVNPAFLPGPSALRAPVMRTGSSFDSKLLAGFAERACGPH